MSYSFINEYISQNVKRKHSIIIPMVKLLISEPTFHKKKQRNSFKTFNRIV